MMVFLCYEQGYSAWESESWDNWQWPTRDDCSDALSGEMIPYIKECTGDYHPHRGRWQDWFWE